MTDADSLAPSFFESVVLLINEGCLEDLQIIWFCVLGSMGLETSSKEGGAMSLMADGFCESNEVGMA